MDPKAKKECIEDARKFLEKLGLYKAESQPLPDATKEREDVIEQYITRRSGSYHCNVCVGMPLQTVTYLFTARSQKRSGLSSSAY